MIAITETFSGVVPVENATENKPSLPVRCIGQIPVSFMIVRSMVTRGVSRFQAKRVRKRSTRRNIARLVHLPLKFIQKLTESPFSQRSKFPRQAEGVFSRITKRFCSLVTTPSEVCRKFLPILAVATLPVRSSLSLFESYNFANGQSYVAKIK